MILASDVEVDGGAALARGDDPKSDYSSVHELAPIAPIVDNLGDKTLTRYACEQCGSGNRVFSLNARQSFTLPEAPVEPVGIIEGGLKGLNVLGKTSTSRFSDSHVSRQR